MNPKYVQYHIKVERLLEKFITTKSQNQVDTNLEKFVTYLCRLQTKEQTLLVFTKWLQHAVVTWSTKRKTPPVSIASFTLKLTSLLSKTEETFCELNSIDCLNRLINTLKVRQLDVVPILKLGYIELLVSFLEHKSGIDWIRNFTFWEDILKFSLYDQCVEVVNRSIDFMSKILVKLIDYDDSFCKKVVVKIILPLVENHHNELTLKLIANILDFVFERIWIDKGDFRIAFLFLDGFYLKGLPECFVLPLVHTVHLLKIKFYMEFLELYLAILQNRVTSDIVKASISTLKKNFLSHLSKGDFEEAMELCNFGYTYWKLVDSKLLPGTFKNHYCLSDHLLIMILFPEGCQLCEFLSMGQWEEKNCLDDYRSSNVYIFFKNVHPNFLRIGYYWRNILVENRGIGQMIIDAFVHLKNMRRFFCKHSAILVFQILVYNFKDIICVCKGNADKLEKLHSQVYFGEHLEFLTLLIEEFQITWKDHCEVVNLISTCFDFLMFSWPTKEVFQALKLINVAIRNYMSPNMSLLVDTTADSTLDHLGFLLSTKLDEVNEVKLAALEVIYTMACISRGSKFSAIFLVFILFQRHMFKSLITLSEDNATISFIPSNVISIVCLRCVKMFPNVTQYQLKIKQLLQKLIEVKCHISESSLEKFLSKLCDHEKKEIESALIALPIVTEWIMRAVTTWSATRVTPPKNIVSFLLSLAGLLSKDEERFCVLNNNNFFIKLVNVVKVRQSGADTSIKLAYIELLSSFLEHRSGIEWMIVCTFWEDIYEMSLRDDYPETSKQCIAFISKLLGQTIDYDEHFCENLIKRMMLPLARNMYKSVKEPTDLTNLRPSLKLIGDVLEYFLEGIFFDDKDFRVVLIFLKHFHQDECRMVESNLNDFILKRIIYSIHFLELYVNAVANGVSVAITNTSIDKIKKDFMADLTKGSYDDVMLLSKFGLLYWNLVATKIPGSNKESIQLFDHLIILLIIPYCSLITRYVSLQEFEEEYENDDFRDAFLTRFMKLLSQESMRFYYIWRDDLEKRSDVFKICTTSFIYVKEIRKYFIREEAVVVFQTMYYSLKDFLWVIEKSPNSLGMFLNEPAYFFEILEVLILLIEEYEITWKDSYEATDVLSTCLEFLILTSWPTDIIVQTLKLINVATAKYMCANMALLVDRTSDSAINLLGPFLYSKLHDSLIDVKIAALEVICTVGRMSRSKFPSLQKVLMDSELPTLVVKMSTCDSESFVRATAIKCLQEMIQVEEIWNNALKTEDLPQKMRDVLLNETEGIVRVEAATFMCVAYENQQLPKETLDRVYETMIYSSTTDLHWEVKVRALDFWDKVIKNHLQNQGMIDGSFPNVTFSKEHRKIVTLTDSEIRKRLLKVLSQLSSIGCLGVLMSAIKDDCDMEVSKTAAKISQGLVDLFKKYNVRSDGSTPTSPLPTENGMSTASVSSGVSVDESMDSPATNHHDLNEEIIDQIVNSKDICLLKNVYTPSDYGSVSNYDIQVRRIVTPNEFLQFTQQDLNSIINEKKNWLNGIEDLGSLLDDMLKTYDDDVNNMDCY